MTAAQCFHLRENPSQPYVGLADNKGRPHFFCTVCAAKKLAADLSAHSLEDAYLDEADLKALLVEWQRAVLYRRGIKQVPKPLTSFKEVFAVKRAEVERLIRERHEREALAAYKARNAA